MKRPITTLPPNYRRAYYWPAITARSASVHTRKRVAKGRFRPSAPEGAEELKFDRFKKRADDTVQLEFNQTIYKDTKTGKWYVEVALQLLHPIVDLSSSQTASVYSVPYNVNRLSRLPILA